MAARVARARPARRGHGARQHGLSDRRRRLRAAPRGNPGGGHAARARAPAARGARGHRCRVRDPLRRRRRGRRRLRFRRACRGARGGCAACRRSRLARSRQRPVHVGHHRRAQGLHALALVVHAIRVAGHDPARRARRDRHHRDLAALPLRRSAVEPRGGAAVRRDARGARPVPPVDVLGKGPRPSRDLVLLPRRDAQADAQHAALPVRSRTFCKARHLLGHSTGGPCGDRGALGRPVVRSLRHDRVRSRHRGRARRPRRDGRHRLHRHADARARGARRRRRGPTRAGRGARRARAARRRADGRLLPQPPGDRRRVPQRLAAHRRRRAPATRGAGFTTSRA